ARRVGRASGIAESALLCPLPWHAETPGVAGPPQHAVRMQDRYRERYRVAVHGTQGPHVLRENPAAVEPHVAAVAGAIHGEPPPRSPRLAHMGSAPTTTTLAPTPRCGAWNGLGAPYTTRDDRHQEPYRPPMQIPTEAERAFRLKPNTDSEGSRTPVPTES